MSEKRFPTEIIDLPSKGLCYPEDNALSNGKIELRYMTAKDEDILTSQNLIQKGIVIDELLKSIIVTPINYDELMVGDKNAIMFATRVMGYGSKYNVEINCPVCNEKNQTIIDLQLIETKEIEFGLLNRNNEYSYTLPKSNIEITFKLLTHKDEKEISQRISDNKILQKKINTKVKIDNELSIRLKQMILSVNGNKDRKTINDFVDRDFLAIDTKEFRKYAFSIMPDMNLDYKFSCEECGEESIIKIPLTVEFFWPAS